MPTLDALKASDELTLAEFLKRYPWPEEWLKKGKPLHFFWKFDLPVPIEKLWPYLIDLSSFNRRVGMGAMKFSEKNGRLQGEAVNVGVKMAWEEVPWEWEYGKEFSHARVYSRGLPYYMRARYLFTETEPGKCRLTAYLSWIPRGPISRTLIKIGLKPIKKGYVKALKEIVQAIQQDQISFPPPPPVKLTPEGASRLKNIGKTLVEAGISQKLAEKLVKYVETTPDNDIYRIRVKPLARDWNIPEKEVLTGFLIGTRQGLFKLTWDVICPHCRGVRNEVKTLGELPKRGTCEACQVDFDATAFNTLEVTFHAHPSLRVVEKQVYCAAEPGTKPHIKMQKTVSAMDQLKLGTLLGSGRYRLRIIGKDIYNLLDVDAQAQGNEVKWDDALSQQNLKSAYFPTLLLKNNAAQANTFILEESQLDQDTLRPVDLFNFQNFRDLFSQEALASELKLEIGVQTILFTDLVGSTKFYEVEGDTVAFTEVKEHFNKTYEVVQKHDGVIVKTIGDAVMAAFSHQVDAVKAGIELQKYFSPTNPKTRLRLRVTLNTGSCLAVNLNSNIDYFGNTVNLAAKIQAVAGAGEIAFTENVLKDPDLQKLIQDEKIPLEKLDFEMKWSKRTIPVYRMGIS
jgi:class 3 adenylate cyclase